MATIKKAQKGVSIHSTRVIGDTTGFGNNLKSQVKEIDSIMDARTKAKIASGTKGSKDDVFEGKLKEKGAWKKVTPNKPNRVYKSGGSVKPCLGCGGKSKKKK